MAGRFHIKTATVRAVLAAGVLAFVCPPALAQQPETIIEGAGAQPAMRRVTIETPEEAAAAERATEPRATSPGAETDTAADVPECARDPDRLGIERIVEVDTTDGPVFGGSHGYASLLNDKEVVLTFDDGPMRAYTRRVLQALKDHCTRATFFMVGRMAASDPAMVREVLAQGHTVGSHTWSHQNMKPIGLIKGRREFEMGLSAINKAAGRPIAPFFRFPYLSESRQVLAHLKERNTATFFIDIDSKDFQTRDSSVVFDRVMNSLAATRKGIILMHDIQPSTAGMIKRLLDTLHRKGYKVVHVVPKVPTETIAEFDTQADKLLAARKSKADKPLADRSFTWTANTEGESVDTGSVEKPAAATAAKAPAKPEQPAARTATQTGDLPWKKPAAKPAAALQPAKRSVPRPQQEELPWQARVFAN